MSDLKVGDTVRLSQAGLKCFANLRKSRKRPREAWVGKVVGHSSDRTCVWVIWSHVVTRDRFANDFVEVIR